MSKPINGCQPLPALLLLMGLLSGCSLAPDYQAPSSPVPQDLSGAVAQDASSPASSPAAALSDDEKELLESIEATPELPRLVEQALNYNRDLRLALLRVEQARAQFGITRADRFPTVALSVQRNRQHLNDKTLNERYGQDIAVASAGVSDFELDFFGRVRSLSEAARHDYLATRLGAEAARKALVVEVARLFLQTRLQGVLRADAQLIADNQAQMLTLLASQQREGAVAQDTVDTQRMDTRRAERQLQAAIEEHQRALRSLSWVTGYQTALVIPDRQATPMGSGTPGWLADMPSQRLLQRFDVRQCEETLRAANANIGAARAAFFPSITLSTGVGIASPHLSSLFSSGSGAWLFTPQVNLPIFDGGRNRANLDLAELRQKSAVAQYEKTVQDAFREVADLLGQRQQALANASTQAQLTTLAQAKAVRIAQQVSVGAAARAELPASNIRLAESDMDARRAAYDLLFNRLALYRALSGAPQFSNPEGVSP